MWFLEWLYKFGWTVCQFFLALTTTHDHLLFMWRGTGFNYNEDKYSLYQLVVCFTSTFIGYKFLFKSLTFKCWIIKWAILPLIMIIKLPKFLQDSSVQIGWIIIYCLLHVVEITFFIERKPFVQYLNHLGLKFAQSVGLC